MEATCGETMCDPIRYNGRHVIQNDSHAISGQRRRENGRRFSDEFVVSFCSLHIHYPAESSCGSMSRGLVPIGVNIRLEWNINFVTGTKYRDQSTETEPSKSRRFYGPRRSAEIHPSPLRQRGRGTDEKRIVMKYTRGKKKVVHRDKRSASSEGKRVTATDAAEPGPAGDSARGFSPRRGWRVYAFWE